VVTGRGIVTISLSGAVVTRFPFFLFTLAFISEAFPVYGVKEGRMHLPATIN
jgi:hypothetical protein